jgi:uncharacterized protein
MDAISLYSGGLLFLGGLIAGAINTLAGNGSIITLTLCTEWVGLTPSVANGTNRLGVLMQSLSGTWALHRHHRLSLHGTKAPMVVVIIGSLLGIWLATWLEESEFKKLYPWFLLFIFLVLLAKPDRWIRPNPNPQPVFPWYIWPIWFVIGMYGGLIQLGVGVFFLAAMILLGRFGWPEANAAKIVVVAIFTVIAVAAFGISGMIHLPTALILAIGQALGAWAAVKYLIGIPQAQKISYYLLLTVTGITLLRYFIL